MKRISFRRSKPYARGLSAKKAEKTNSIQPIFGMSVTKITGILAL